MPRHFLSRIGVGLVGVTVGAVVGGCVTLLHALWWGLALGVAATLAALWAMPSGWWRRSAFGFGWSGIVLGLTLSRSEGDYLIASDVPGYVMMAMALGVLMVAVLSIRVVDRGTRDDVVAD